MERRRAGRPCDLDPEETRKTILAAAERVFAELGYSGATTRRISGDARVNVATLHYHFGGKEGLYRAVLQAALANQPIQDREAGAPEERLRLLLSRLFHFSLNRPFLSRLALLDYLAGPVPRGGDLSGSRPQDWRVDLVRSVLEAVQGSGEPANLDSDRGMEETAKLVVRFLDLASVTGRSSSSHLREKQILFRAGRNSVIEAALQLCGTLQIREQGRDR
jgi:AcrR family transcriptional regulator